MHVLHLSRRLRKPFLIHDVEVVLLRGNRRCSNQSSVVGIAGDADQIVLVRLIEKVHFLIKRVRRQILVLNNAVVHGVGNTPHVAQITLQIDCRLVQQLLRALRRHIFHFIDKTVVQGNPQNTHTDDRYNRKRQCNRHLNGLRLDVFFQEGTFCRHCFTLSLILFAPYAPYASCAASIRLVLYLDGDMPNCFLNT